MYRKGNIVTTHIFLILEPSIALISICLPSIFYLIKIIGGMKSSHQEDPSKPLSRSHVFLARLTGKVTNSPEVHDKGLLELKDVHFHTITPGERSFDNSASTEYHVDAFPDHDQRSEDLIRENQDLEEQEQCIYVRNTVDVGRT